MSVRIHFIDHPAYSVISILTLVTHLCHEILRVTFLFYSLNET